MTKQELVVRMQENNAWVPGKRVKIDFGADQGVVMLDGAGQKVSEEDGPADTTIRVGWDDWQQLAAGQLDGMTAFMMGKLPSRATCRTRCSSRACCRSSRASSSNCCCRRQRSDSLCPMHMGLILVMLTGAASAQQSPMLDAKAAQAIVTGCAAHASSKMQSEAIAVVDTGGHLIAALRMDGNTSGIFDFALAKAEAAAAWGFSTAQMADAAKGTPGFANAPHVVTVAGGMPVWSADGNARIGAVGVSGEEPADDAECAEAGVKAAGLSTSRS